MGWTIDPAPANLDLTMPTWVVTTTIVLVGMLVSPSLTIAACGAMVAAGRLGPVHALADLCGAWIAQGAALWALARTAPERARAWPIVGARFPTVSPHDWSRRLSSRPLRTGFEGQFTPRLRPTAWWALGELAGFGHPAGTLDPGLTSDQDSRGLKLAVQDVARFIVARFAGIAAWSAVALGVAGALAIAATTLFRLDQHPVVALGVLILIALAVRMLVPILVPAGRRETAATLGKLTRHEFWPAWLFYLPLYVYLIRLSFKHGGLMTPSRCNPGIENGGGIVGESKHAILSALADGAPALVRPFVLPTFLVEPGPIAERIGRIESILRDRSDIIRRPFIIKPNAGQRGFGVKVIRDLDQLLAYFQQMDRACVVQAFHPGPEECGVLWARDLPDPARTTNASAPTGRIFSITRKSFPRVVGDGARTLEELITEHPRHRYQAGTFLTRLADDATRVPSEGESVPLGLSGNHCQGARFADGSDLITPELEHMIDELASRFPGGLDFGRFDIRYENDSALRAGASLGIVELNGTFSESTNLYDPDRSIVWAYRVLFAQWRTLYRLGAWRRDQSNGPGGLRVRDLLAAVFRHFHGRAGPAVAD